MGFNQISHKPQLQNMVLSLILHKLQSYECKTKILLNVMVSDQVPLNWLSYNLGLY